MSSHKNKKKERFEETHGLEPKSYKHVEQNELERMLRDLYERNRPRDMIYHMSPQAQIRLEQLMREEINNLQR